MAQGNAPRADWETVDVGSAIPMPPLDDLHDDAHAFVPAPISQHGRRRPSSLKGQTS